MTRALTFPISNEDIRSLRVGDAVALSGIVVTARDAVHKWLADIFIRRTRLPSPEDWAVFNAVQPILKGGALYHCGPVVAGLEDRQYRFVAAGPTTSIREEPYQADVMRLLDLKGVIGKGGMAGKTLVACQAQPAVYFHAIGGAASFMAQSVKRVLTVHKLEFGVPEAMWVIEVRDFPAVVTMDAHGGSLHERVRAESKNALDRLLGNA